MILIKRYKGYWTVFVDAEPVMSFDTKDEAEAIFFRLPEISPHQLCLSAIARVTYLVLCTVVDDLGCFTGDMRALSQLLFWADRPKQELVPQSLEQLQAEGLIRHNRMPNGGVSIALSHFVGP